MWICMRLGKRIKNFSTITSDTVKFRTIHKKGTEKQYDLVVIGGGSGGLACAKEAASLGKRVAVLDYVESSIRGTSWGLGGTCVNVGCIPKKLFHYASCLGDALHDSKSYGWDIQNDFTHNWTVLKNAASGHIKSLNWGHRVQLKQKNVEYFNAKGAFFDSHTIEIFRKGSQERISASNIVIAVGGRPRYPTNVPGAHEYAISSDDLFNLEKPPGKTLVIGASYVALECAGFLTGLGFNTSVMVRSIFLRGFDQQMADMIVNHMSSQGTCFIRNSFPLKIEKHLNNSQLKVTWQNNKGTISEDEFDTVLFAIGREAQTQSLGLGNIGVEVHQSSRKVIGYNGEQSSVPHIYAIGDILHGTPELTPVAIKAGKLLAQRLFATSKLKMDYENIATTVFTPLEYSCVGLSEELAIQKYGVNELEVYHSFYAPLEFSIPHKSAAYCYIKAICKHKNPQKVLGLHITGPNAGEIIQGFACAMKCGLTLENLQQTVGIHPTIAEEIVKLNVTKRSGLDPTVTGC